MATDSFRRHVRTSVDAALRLAFGSLCHEPEQLAFLARLLRVVASRSNALSWSPTRERELVQVKLLQNLAPFEQELVRDPEDWPGATGHPLLVADSLTSHLFGRYPTARFLASAWFGSPLPAMVERRQWCIAHARGGRFRTLATPFRMTRQMEHLFLRTPDHYAFAPAIRRAEILALGGSPELADAVLATRLADDFSNIERWRVALGWLARCGDAVPLADIRPLIDFLAANLETVELRGRTFASVMRLVRGWHAWLGRQRERALAWPRSRWNAMQVIERRHGHWTIVELLDSRELAQEGREMHHCVSTYARGCAIQYSSIWSLRYRGDDDASWRSVLTIEVRHRTGQIVQLRGKANALPRGEPLDLVRRWAAREGLRLSPHVPLGDVPATRLR